MRLLWLIYLDLFVYGVGERFSQLLFVIVVVVYCLCCTALNIKWVWDAILAEMHVILSV